MKVTELFEAKLQVKQGGKRDEDATFGFESKSNAAKTAKALKASGIKFERNSNFGIEYFHFDSMKDLRAAVKIAQGVIDFSQEHEWKAPRRPAKLKEATA
jgi:hypothetical protein